MLNTTRKEVEILLLLYPETRDNDNLLIARYLEHKFGVTDTFEIAKRFKANVYESVRRARQKVMEENPNLRPSKEVYDKRLEKEERVRQEVKKIPQYKPILEQKEDDEQLVEEPKNIAEMPQNKPEITEQLGLGFVWQK